MVGRFLMAGALGLVGGGVGWGLWFLLASTLLGFSPASLIAGYFLPMVGFVIGAAYGWRHVSSHGNDGHVCWSRLTPEREVRLKRDVDGRPAGSKGTVVHVEPRIQLPYATPPTAPLPGVLVRWDDGEQHWMPAKDLQAL